MTASVIENQDPELRIEDRVKTASPTLNPRPLASLSPILLQTTSEDHHIARMAALALGLSVLEAAIPSPLPGVKPGLANIVILVVLARYGWRTAAWVSLMRVLAGGLLMGSFLSPGFFIGLSGALCSLAILAISQHLPQRWFGPVTHSILAAFAHIAGQLLLVYLWLIPHAGLAYLLPVFATAALVFGTVNGLIAARFIDTPESRGELIT
jgi:heptaprenyl diphosphate synthase